MPRKHGDQEESQRIAAEIGARLQIHRRRRGWTQELVSERVGLSSEAYARLERGKSLPSFPTLLRLCEVFEVTPDGIIGGALRHSSPRNKDDVAAADAAQTGGADPESTAERRRDELAEMIRRLDSRAVDAFRALAVLLLDR